MTQIEQLVNLLRKNFAIPCLVISVGIIFMLVKLFLVWFGPDKEVEIKLADINPAKKEKFFLQNQPVSLSNYEIIPKKNLFRPSRTEWHPPPPPPKPVAPPPPPPKPVPPPEITVTGIIDIGAFDKRAILDGKYFMPKSLEEKKIKKKGYKLYEMIGPYRIQSINNNMVLLIDPQGKSYEFYLKGKKRKKKHILKDHKKVKGKNLIGTAIFPSSSKTGRPPLGTAIFPSSSKTGRPPRKAFQSQHISGN